MRHAVRARTHGLGTGGGRRLDAIEEVTRKLANTYNYSSTVAPLELWILVDT